jgi:hypothetical protein
MDSDSGTIAVLENYPTAEELKNGSTTFSLSEPIEIPKDRNALNTLLGLQ